MRALKEAVAPTVRKQSFEDDILVFALRELWFFGWTGVSFFQRRGRARDYGLFIIYVLAAIGFGVSSMSG